MDNTVLNYSHIPRFCKTMAMISMMFIDQLPEVLLNAKVVLEIDLIIQTLKQRIIEKYPSLDAQIIKDINNNDRIISFVCDHKL